MREIMLVLTLLVFHPAAAQQDSSAQQRYEAALKQASKQFDAWFYPNYVKLYSLPESAFTTRIDSVRNSYNALLTKFENQLPPLYVHQELTSNKFYFDNLLIDYPEQHDNYTGRTSRGRSRIAERMRANVPDLNNPALLRNRSFHEYARSFFDYHVSLERRNKQYDSLDNQELWATWAVLPRFVSQPECLDFWRTEYLHRYMDNNGIKDIDSIYEEFLASCRDTNYLNLVTKQYKEQQTERADHVIRTYKTVGPFNLDIHLFLPDSLRQYKPRPVIVYFHSGGWSEGKPDWSFATCHGFAKQAGWVACAVEYRTYDRHGTLPFAAVKDARSAIRWLRQHSAEYNIDTNKIVASGNAAGGHLALCTALANQWNESTDDLHYSPRPNALLVNAATYDLNDSAVAWVRKDQRNPSLIKSISPLYLIQNNFPPALIIHGMNDKLSPYTNASLFVDKMERAGASGIEFHGLAGAEHYIWIDHDYSDQVAKLRGEFIKALNY